MAFDIKEKAEDLVGVKYSIYEPIAYNYESVENLKKYYFKVKIGVDKYIHIIVIEEINNKKSEIYVTYGIRLFDPFVPFWERIIS